MSPPEDFAGLIQRVRAGDADAAAELVRRYEPEVRRIIHVRLTDPALRRLFDTVDICQSVLGNFFAHAGRGDFHLDSPEDLVKLLVTMARNKLRDQARRQRAARRDQRRLSPGDDLSKLPASDQTPSRIVAGRELLRQVGARLSGEDRYLVEQRALGREWSDLAVELGCAPDALRMRLRRALQKVTDELGAEASGFG